MWILISHFPLSDPPNPHLSRQIVFGGTMHGGLIYNDLWMLELRDEDEAGEGLMW